MVDGRKRLFHCAELNREKENERERWVEDKTAGWRRKPLTVSVCDGMYGV